MKKNQSKAIIAAALLLTLILGAAILFIKNETRQLDAAYTEEAAITPEPTLAPPTIFAKPTDRLLKIGSIGKDVKSLQERLKQLNYYQGEVDGQFGNDTKKALRLFQEQNRLTADGIAGEKTLKLIFSESAKAFKATPTPKLPSVSKKSLPLLVSPAHPLPRDYAPGRMVLIKKLITDDLFTLSDDQMMADETAAQALNRMLSAARQDSVVPWTITDAFRTRKAQQALFDKRVSGLMEKGMNREAAEAEAVQTVARPGTSEHETGLAFNLSAPNAAFEDSEQFRWLRKNAHRFGFILRYPKGKEAVTGYPQEAGHIRYVGQEHAGYMHATGLTLEEYLALFH